MLGVEVSQADDGADKRAIGIARADQLGKPAFVLGVIVVEALTQQIGPPLPEFAF